MPIYNQTTSKNTNRRQPNIKVVFLFPCQKGKKQCEQANQLQNMSKSRFTAYQTKTVKHQSRSWLSAQLVVCIQNSRLLLVVTLLVQSVIACQWLALLLYTDVLSGDDEMRREKLLHAISLRVLVKNRQPTSRRRRAALDFDVKYQEPCAKL
jgi:hypothetical protein